MCMEHIYVYIFSSAYNNCSSLQCHLNITVALPSIILFRINAWICDEAIHIMVIMYHAGDADIHMLEYSSIM